MAEFPEGPEKICDTCGHGSDAHVVIAFVAATVADVEDVPVAGIILCPNLTCMCMATWSMKGFPRPTEADLPPQREIDALRTELQTTGRLGA